MRKFNKNTILVNPMEGIGDQIYIRPFVKELSKKHEVYINTFTPFLYSDLNVQFVDPRRKNPQTRTYRTQQKSFLSDVDPKIYVKEPPYVGRVVETHYKGEEILKTSIVANFFSKFNIPFETKIEWTLPSLMDQQELIKKVESMTDKKIQWDKIAIVRPATVRKEWEVHTRNANSAYIAWCSKVLIEFGYTVISIADCSDNEEWIVQPAPPAHVHLHKGELGIKGTLELLRCASVIVGGSGFIVPAAASVGTPLFIIFGGRMAYDTPYKIFHNSMDMNKIGWAVPDNPCRCTLTQHNCDKSIAHLDTIFLEFIRRITNV